VTVCLIFAIPFATFAHVPRCKMIAQSRCRAALHENVEAFPTDLLENLVGRLDFTWVQGAI